MFRAKNWARKNRGLNHVREATRNFGLEGLESRTLLSVSLDANGWTVVGPSSDTRTIYVSSSAGNDANSGLSESAPVRTLAKGYSLLRHGSPDWLLLKRGDSWSEGLFMTKGGRSASEPLLISAYGTGERPTLLSGGNNAISSYVTSGSPASLDNIALIGLHMYANTRDPAHGATDAATTPYGIFINRPMANFLIEDSEFEFYRDNLAIMGSQADGIRNLQVRRNVIHHSYSTSTHSQGLYVSNARGTLLEDNVFYHNGFNPAVPGATATIYNHHVYLQTEAFDNVVRGNITADGDAIQVRAGGIVENNLFVRDSIGLLVAGNTSRVTGNVILEGKDITSSLPRGWGIDVASQSGAIISNNTIAHSNTTGWAMRLMNTTNAQVSNNTIYDWPRGIVEDNAAGTVLTDNRVGDGYAYVDPNRSLASYHGTLGRTATFEAFMTEALKQSRTYWRPQYTAGAVIQYINQGFSTSATVTPPTVTIAATTATTEGSPTPGAFTVTRSGSTASSLTVNYTLGGTAINGTDYTRLGGSIVIPAGAASAIISIVPADDTLVEGNETVLLTLASNTAYTLGAASSASLTIADNDLAAPPTEPEPDPEPSGTSTKFDFGTGGSPLQSGYTRISEATLYSSTLGYGWVSGTIASRDRSDGTYLTRDFNYTPLGTFAANVANGIYDVVLTLGDAHYAHDQMGITIEGNLAGTVSTAAGQFSTVTYRTQVSDSQLTILLDDFGGTDPNVVVTGLEIQPVALPPTVTIATTTATTEGSPTPGAFTVTRSGSTASSLTVNYTLGGTAINGTDYTRLGGSIVIPAGAASAIISIVPADDTLVEGNETVLLTLASNTAYTLGAASSASLTIADNDVAAPPPTTSGTSYQFDFGTKKSPLQRGYTRISEGTRYSSSAGYGWISGTIASRDRSTGTYLTRDFNYTTLGAFGAKVVNGAYDVTLTMGDAHFAHEQMGITIEGKFVGSVSAAAGQFSTVTYRAEVTDGQVTILFDDLGGADGNVVINSIEIKPATFSATPIA